MHCMLDAACMRFWLACVSNLTVCRDVNQPNNYYNRKILKAPITPAALVASAASRRVGPPLEEIQRPTQQVILWKVPSGLGFRVFPVNLVQHFWVWH